jgi:signal transduction histidine kinase
MLISGILCTVLSLTTWLFRRRENINRVFAFLTLALAIDSFAYFVMFQFGHAMDNSVLWMRLTFTAGYLVPTGVVLFFLAFTGYDKRMDARVLGVKVRHFQIAALSFIAACMVLSMTTQQLIRVPESPDNIWDLELGSVGTLMFPLFAVVFFYLFTMAFKAYRAAQHRPERRFILLLAVGTLLWLLFGYGGAVVFDPSSEAWHSTSYMGTSVMAIFFFVAIVNFQSDKVHELNLSLERKVEDRTRHLRETQAQLIQSEKVAALGHLVAGVAHEMNTPVGAVYSTHSTLASAMGKLKQTLTDEHGVEISESHRVSNILNAIAGVSDVIRTSSERITGIVKRLTTFAQLDEADLQNANLNECIENTLAMFQFDLKPEITIRKELADLPVITCYPAQINQLCFQLLSNANRAIADAGEIVLRTEVVGDEVRFSVSDDGRGIPPEAIDRIFDPGYTAWDLNVGTGLGLAICYQVAREHNGRINVESEIGKGTTLTLSLPVQGRPNGSPDNKP